LATRLSSNQISSVFGFVLLKEDADVLFYGYVV